MAKIWTDEEIKLLIDNYPYKSNKWLADSLNTSEASVMHKSYRMGLRKCKYKKNTGWSEEDLKYLKENYANVTNIDIGEFLGKSSKAVLNRANRMNLTKSKKHIQKISSERSSKITIKEKELRIGKYKCEVCDNGFDSYKSLNIHLTKKHQYDVEKYYLKYLGTVSKCKYCNDDSRFLNLHNGYGDLCKKDECISKSRTYSTKEWHKINNSGLYDVYIEDKTQKMIETNKKLLKENPNFYKEKSHNSKEYWIKRGYTEEEAIRNSAEVVVKMQSVSHKLRKESPDKYSHCYNSKIEYYLAKGMSEEDALIALSDRQTTFSKKICIEKYGEKEGLLVWKERQNKWISNMPRLNYSKISQELFISIWHHIKHIKYTIYFATLNIDQIYGGVDRNFEYRLELVNSYILPDFYIPELNKIIEFDGTYYHRKNPENKKRDKIRDKGISDIGLSVLHIKEDDYNKDKKGTVQKCIDFLLNNNNNNNKIK